MAVLPDDLWRRILEIGIIESSPRILSYKDLCSLSIVCRPFNRLSKEDFLWSSLLSSDIPGNRRDPSTHSSSKSLYKLWFQRDLARKALIHRRSVLRIESEVAEHSRKLKELEVQLAWETDKFNAALLELSNLRNVRQASVALNVWQPEVIRVRQKKIVEQCVVDVNTRISALDMELKLCKQQITGVEKARIKEKRRLDATKEQLASIKYHPLRDYYLTSSRADEDGINRKKLKKSINIFKATHGISEE